MKFRDIVEKESFMDLKIEIQKFLKKKFNLNYFPLYMENDFNGQIVKYKRKDIEITYCADCYDKEVFSIERK